MKTLLSILITPIHVFIFILILCTFHIIFLITNTFFPKKVFLFWHDLQNLSHVLNMKLAGTKFNLSLESLDSLPKEAPLVFVSNHQSMYDIPLIAWTLRKYQPRFIAKKELARFIPAISYSLRNAGHIVIDRQDPKSAMEQIKQSAQNILQDQNALCIFPEGTRAKDGEMKAFKVRGLSTLLDCCQNGYVVPLVLDGSWKIVRHHLIPTPFGERFTLRALKPIKITAENIAELPGRLENEIRDELKVVRAQA